jgi:hypothetical protein
MAMVACQVVNTLLFATLTSFLCQQSAEQRACRHNSPTHNSIHTALLPRRVKHQQEREEVSVSITTECHSQEPVRPCVLALCQAPHHA